MLVINCLDHPQKSTILLTPGDLTCPYQPTDNAYPRYLDAVINDVKDDVACEVQCTFYEPFVCRSFAFYPSALQCFISGDDQGECSSSFFGNCFRTWWSPFEV